MGLNDVMFYLGFFSFFFVAGGIAGDTIFVQMDNAFVVSGIVTGLIGVTLSRFILTLMKV